MLSLVVDHKEVRKIEINVDRKKLSYVTSAVPQNSRCSYTDCSSVATDHLKYMWKCEVGCLS
jgi:hypothetical protein